MSRLRTTVPFFEQSGQRISFFLREFCHMPGRILGDRELAGQAHERVDAPASILRVWAAASGLAGRLWRVGDGERLRGEQLRDGISQRLRRALCETLLGGLRDDRGGIRVSTAAQHVSRSQTRRRHEAGKIARVCAG